MAQLSIPDGTFQQLTARAAALNISVEELVKPVLERLVETGPPAAEAAPLTGAAWWAELQAWRWAAQARSGRYPPGFRVDDSRESIYREREDAQL